MRPIQELAGTWMNADCPREQYIIEGLQVTRIDGRGTRNFTIHWNQALRRWEWGAHGHLSLQWLGDDSIAWVPDVPHVSPHARVWRWQRCESPSPIQAALEPCRSNYGPLRQPRANHTVEQPYSGRSWQHWVEQPSRDWQNTSNRHHHREHHRDHHRDHHHNYHRDRHHDHCNRRSHGGTTSLGASTPLPCGLTPVEVSDLLSRDITPEDYELLLRLDSSIPRPALSMESTIQGLREVVCEDFMGGECAVCLCPFEMDDTVASLSCQHQFHRGCITKWLSEYRRTCPLCCSDALPTN